MDVTVKFLGAAGSVTGSRYLVTLDDFRFLFDCGLFQGLKELRLRNWDPFPVDPATIDAVVISHAHIDHTGYLPKLVSEGFAGPIYCTHPTADLMEIMLLDSAKLQEEEAAYARKKGYSRHESPKPLYTQEDARSVFPLLKVYGYKQRIKIHERVDIVYHDAGHLLGSAITEIFIRGDQQTKKLVFSGDIGRYQQPLLNTPEAIDEADVLFIESTYGNKDNPFDDPTDELKSVINETFDNGGVVLIPAFAVGRTQTLLYYLRELMAKDVIPDVPVYVDSPMAISATYLFFKHPDYHKVPLTLRDFANDVETNMLVLVKSSEHSRKLNDITRNAIIISSSGMMTGGRILHHLYNRLPHARDTLIIAGFQAKARARDLLEGKKVIRIFGQEVPVKCRVEYMSSLSGHADRGELFKWMGNFKTKPKMTFTVHGEGKDMLDYAQAIRDKLGWNVTTPMYMESFKLFDHI
ncbi:MAG: MBL fold metallo-hydrolase [Bacteroidia bacterium]|nr:MBL fold metallo-hydrolase [Bacteroidia bacterium]